MKVAGKFKIDLAGAGDTGYQNQSSLVIGDIDFPSDSWGNEHTNPISVGDWFCLSIPSGNLWGTIYDVRHKRTELFVDGWWNGKLAGLLGGMSGYCQFEPIDSLMKDASGWLTPIGTEVSYEQYLLLHRTKNTFGLQFDKQVTTEIFHKLLQLSSLIDVSEMIESLKYEIKREIRKNTPKLTEDEQYLVDEYEPIPDEQEEY